MKRIMTLTSILVLLLAMNVSSFAHEDKNDMLFGYTIIMARALIQNINDRGCMLVESKSNCGIATAPKVISNARHESHPAENRQSNHRFELFPGTANVVNDIITNYNDTYQLDLNPDDPWETK